jgi:hypothetical protein
VLYTFTLVLEKVGVLFKRITLKSLKKWYPRISRKIKYLLRIMTDHMG